MFSEVITSPGINDWNLTLFPARRVISDHANAQEREIIRFLSVIPGEIVSSRNIINNIMFLKVITFLPLIISCNSLEFLSLSFLFVTIGNSRQLQET